MIERPQPDDYAPYFGRYIGLVGEGPIVEILEHLQQTSYDFFMQLDPGKASYAYADGKWTVKQVLGHICDTERVFAYRMLTFSRQPGAELPGFDQDVFMERSYFNERTLEDLAEEFRTIRQSTLYLLKSITDEQSKQKGIASGNPVSVRALAYMIAGHEMHHIDILKERYL